MPPPPHHLPPPDEGSEGEFSDDENAPLNQDTYGGSRRSVVETKSWDVFRNMPPSSGSLSEDTQNYMDVTVKALKVFTYLLTFGVVLSCGVITKGLVLLMTSQLRKSKTLSICSRASTHLFSEKDYTVTIPEEENVAWAWVIFFAYCIPELGTVFRSSRMLLFKSSKWPKLADFLIVMLFETFHIIGTVILFYLVLPELDVIKGIMLTNCVAFIPGLFGLLSHKKKEPRLAPNIMMDVIALAAQGTGFVLWPIVEYAKQKTSPNSNSIDPQDMWKICLIPLAVLLTSFGWWENYVDMNARISFIKYLGGIKDRLYRRHRYATYLFVGVWKILIFFSVMLLSMYSRLDDFKKMFELGKAFGEFKLNVTETQEILPNTLLTDIGTSTRLLEVTQITSAPNTHIYVLLIQVFTAWLCYVFSKFACKICIQGFSFAFPVNLTIPVSILLLMTACGLRRDDPCSFAFMPSYLFWECKNGDIIQDFLINDYAWIWLFWLLSQTWITLQIWIPKCERLASTEKLFVTPMYNSLLIDQSVALNRRRDDEGEVKTDELKLDPDEHENEVSQYYETISVHTDASNNQSKARSTDHITRIYATATMWHETEDEMMEMLKSIFRMDEDQSARRVAQKYLKVVDLDYYEFETQIFFDDAFEIADENEDEQVVNQFVRLLVASMDEAASYVHQTNIRIRPPKKFPAPYGGRLVWTLPGKTKIVAHLKDKSKIRHKKRWSQVMYMYYLLGFKLMDQPISVDRKEVIAENTYLLTLDGDIDFTPPAVTLLVDLMKKNTNLGAACGRIHPIGTGVMVWYQMFEYAIGHWLQKSTEHMIGCVLCSPGCFSLFRGKALMDDNVMAKYTTKSSQARHYVQYDQGEDRWLCTLLLQRGYRVEYSAASDAYTHCPEGFSEFYNQRRRWVPSTMANIMDLLQDYKKTIQINDNISLPYISYQTMLMAGTILGPGTIFLMLVGAFVAAFKIGNWPSFQYNIIPILFFMVTCFTMKSNIQIKLAWFMTAFYAMVMVVVLVAMVLNFVEDGFESPTAIFFMATSGSFIITGLLHPKELFCLPCGFVYYMVVPSMYLLLQIYSCFNLNNVSWGTREVAEKRRKKTKEELEAERKAAEEASKLKKKEGFMGFFHKDGTDDDEGSLELSFAGLFKLMCCVHQKTDTQKDMLSKIGDNLDRISKRLDHIEAGMGLPPMSRKRSSAGHRPSLRGDAGSTSQANNDDDFDDEESEQSVPREERDDLVNPYWIEDKHLKRGEVDYMPGAEVQFFKDLIEKYLHPLDKNAAEQKKVAQDLKELRNLSVFSFSMINAIFVLIVFLLQLNKDKIHIDWPLGVKTNITFVEETNEVHISKEYLQLEPIGLVFVFFFALILIIQFTAMLFHRFGTISHILASTELMCCSKKAEDTTDQAFLERNAITIVKELQKLRGLDGGDYESDSHSGANQISRRKTIRNLERHHQNKQMIGTLDVAFKKRFFSISAEGAENANATPILGNMQRLSVRQDAMKVLAERRDTAVHERRQSRMKTLGAQRRTSFASDIEIIPDQTSQQNMV
ncbi:hyaluronan synthase-like protein kkv [Oratosquilla oratoria]|uniref:hyaluronan synthase-like protein kkv n=1 Tax=Oratosquilla oratoria TaxID=337810 RepID=UPI003F762392